MNRCVGLPAWEGVVSWMCRGGLSVEGERRGVSVCFTQSCSIFPLLQGWKVVGQSGGDFCLNRDTAPHMRGGGTGSWSARSHSQGQEDHGSGGWAPGLPWHSRIIMMGQQPRTPPPRPESFSSPNTGKRHHLKLSERRRGEGSYKPRTALCSQLSKSVGKKKKPSWRAEPCFGWGLVCALLTVLGVWTNGLSTGEFYKQCLATGKHGCSCEVWAGNAEQILGSQFIWRHNTQFLYTTVLSKITN